MAGVQNTVQQTRELAQLALRRLASVLAEVPAHVSLSPVPRRTTSIRSTKANVRVP